MVTLNDIAQEAGVHVTTVSKILIDSPLKFRPSTRRHVQETAQRMGYRANALARALVKGKSNTVGVVAHLQRELEGAQWHAERLEALNEGIQNAGYKTTLVSRGPSDFKMEREYIEDLIARRVDGLMIFADPYFDPAYYESLLARGMPLVLFSVHPEYTHLPSILLDTTKGMYDLTRHLLELGHREIAYLGGAACLRRSNHRVRGFLRALEEAGITPRKGWLMEDEEDTDFEVVQEYTRRLLLQSPRPTAICFSHDESALAGLQVIFEMGLRVPADVSVVGYNDSILARIARPALTTVRQPKASPAREAIRLLRLQMENRMNEADRHVSVATECVFRQSTGPVPADIQSISLNEKRLPSRRGGKNKTSGRGDAVGRNKLRDHNS